MCGYVGNLRANSSAERLTWVTSKVNELLTNLVYCGTSPAFCLNFSWEFVADDNVLIAPTNMKWAVPAGDHLFNY